MLDELEGPDAMVTHVTEFAHQSPSAQAFYLKPWVWHTAVMLEFEDGTTSVVELGWRNGVGGEFEPVPHDVTYFGAIEMPDELILPTLPDYAELRFIDKPFGFDQNVPQDFKRLSEGVWKRDILGAFLHKMKENEGVFTTKQVVSQERTEVTKALAMTKRQVAEKMLNYNGGAHDIYELWTHNCQTFSTDIYNLLTGKNAKPKTLSWTSHAKPDRFENSE